MALMFIFVVKLFTVKSFIVKIDASANVRISCKLSKDDKFGIFPPLAKHYGKHDSCLLKEISESQSKMYMGSLLSSF